MRSLKSLRPLDVAIVVVGLVVLVLAGWLGWSIWSHNRSVEAASPVSRAIRDLEKKVEKSPKNVPLRMTLAQSYTVAGRDSAATEQYQQVLRIKKDYVPAISGLGFLAARQKEWRGSENYWRKAVKLLEVQPTAKMSKQYETANFYLGTSLLEQKKYEEAVGYFKEALRVNRSASDTHFLLAAAYKGLGAKEDYKDELEIVLAFDPNMAEANYEYGQLLLDEGDQAAAAQHFRIAADQAPGRDEPRDALEKLGPFSKRMQAARTAATEDPKKALKEARVAAALEPKNVGALLLLGRLYEQTKEKGMAADTYRSILTADPENPDAKAALERVTDGK